MTTLRTTAAIALLAVSLAACSKSEAPEGGHEAAEANETPHSSSAGLPAGHIDAGKTLAATKNKETGQACVDCHGAEGNAPIDPTYPKLGGQYGDYIAHALQAYRAGDRQNPQMTPQAAALTDQEISDLAAYFGSRPSKLRDLHGVD